MKFALVALVVALPVLASAAPAAKKAQLQEQRSEVRERIEALRQDLARSEASKVSVADRLKETESAISGANRRLRRLAESRASTSAEITRLEEQVRQIDGQIARQQGHLSGLLRAHYTRGDHNMEGDPLRMLLAGRNPNRTAIDYHFLKLLSRAKADLIADLRASATEKERLTGAAREKNAELAAIEATQQQERAVLLDRQKQRQALLARVADRIKAQRREIGVLQRDEKRLASLIEGLKRIAAAKPKPVKPGKPSDKAAPAIRNERIPDPAQASGAFAALKGRLRLPVKGEVAGRFGAPRPEGGITWKGLFIRAAEGAEVHAVAAGRVVFSDWLRGFGNLMIVDHDDDFLSVYGNNQSLLRQAGETVRAGEALATVGNSGGNPESGLYFELRHQGQPFDPMKWADMR
ncbi:MAG: peptidoglycan DD-metalloendopeptidase family protein [Candidatus Nitricoxidivorans perseverans]|uniref:Peptidoglycan DD-metalloendopeptidase family protein n=1 Tax=Candidatus Nitricoxidivorans perseverans TaxID=2975601 RepID=A0AA49IY07_9PROT|nr:MAG: peptidoglycan DD-metalloendopeptidase family protein [Candidatus Nitricoxidivorans perseverans]